MLYATVNPKSRELLLVQKKPSRGVFIALTPSTTKRERHPIGDRILLNVIYPDVYARNKKRGVNFKYSLIPPDPWLVALGMVMWDGIVQGFTWDMVKGAVFRARDILRKDGLAPKSTLKEKTKMKTKTELGFIWTEYSDGRKLRHVFLGLRRTFENEQKRKKLTERWT